MGRWIAVCLLGLALLVVGPSALHAEKSPAPAQAVPQAGATAGTAQTWVNMAWILVCGFLVFFMQAGFALVETGLVRAKNAAHTMAMNVMVYSLGVLGFWVCGFAFMFGNHGPILSLDSAPILESEWPSHAFGLIGHDGFFLAGRSVDMGVLALFLFQVMFLDTAATISTGALAERWKFLAFVIYALFMSTVLYPVYGNWVWGHGWLARMGENWGLGHGHVDFAGSSVVHMVGGVTALAGAIVLGPRLGKFRPDGRPNPLPAHNVPMYMVGTLLLAFGWFGFNSGSTLAASDLNVARIAVNTALASAAGACAAMCYMWRRYRKPDPSFLCNGMLAGLVSITASCAFVQPWAAVLIGAVAGLVVVWSALTLERFFRIDDPVGAIAVHGVSGVWGVLALGLLADGTYPLRGGWNGVDGPVAGLFYGDGAQFGAQCIGLAANLLWVFPVAYGFFRVVDRLVGNRVSPPVEFQGLDVPELGALAYITQDPKVPEGRMIVQVSREPRPATVPPNGYKRFTVVVQGPDAETLAQAWSALCHVTEKPPPAEFQAVYPFMTTFQDHRFRFRGGEPESMRTSLERLLQAQLPGQSVHAHVEMEAK
ncbi:MAG TPA: ammonium transporter [Gemmataceae bacterium]|nr:ammonium transporter [Gemmataceae bacterium]